MTFKEATVSGRRSGDVLAHLDKRGLASDNQAVRRAVTGSYFLNSGQQQT